MARRRVIERSVQSLQRIYAFVVALAVARAIEATFVSPGNTLAFFPERLPVFVAFVVTVVPFFHGMNRHLDRCYIEHEDEHVQGALLFDFFVFFLEAGLLFAFAASVQSGAFGFLIMAAMLTLDTLWALISTWIHYREVEVGASRWARVNVVTVFLIAGVYFFEGYTGPSKTWMLAIIAVARTIADYWAAWALYFPPVNLDSRSRQTQKDG